MTQGPHRPLSSYAPHPREGQGRGENGGRVARGGDEGRCGTLLCGVLLSPVTSRTAAYLDCSVCLLTVPLHPLSLFPRHTLGCGCWEKVSPSSQVAVVGSRPPAPAPVETTPTADVVSPGRPAISGRSVTADGEGRGRTRCFTDR